MSLLTSFRDLRQPLKADELVRAVQSKPALAKEVDGVTGNTPLHFACCNGAPLPLVKALVVADPTAASKLDKDGNLPVMGAVANGASADVVALLLQHHPDGVRARQGRHTLLHQAACHGQSVETVAVLLKAWPGAASERDAEGNAPLHFAAACKAAPAVVKALLAACPESASWRGQMQRYPLSLCLLCEAPPGSVEAIRDAYPAAQRTFEILGDYQNHGHGVGSKFPKGPPRTDQASS